MTHKELKKLKGMSRKGLISLRNVINMILKNLDDKEKLDPIWDLGPDVPTVDLKLNSSQRLKGGDAYGL